ncbi:MULTISPECIES: hypothetical protein [unclassified Microcoleus]|uniref:hypothetical protein n=1 Tax=unclassified Microcoleus TaxID=2642155 RepID=UPI002FD41E55
MNRVLPTPLCQRADLYILVYGAIANSTPSFLFGAAETRFNRRYKKAPIMASVRKLFFF